jgi:hypothetical protein
MGSFGAICTAANGEAEWGAFIVITSKILKVHIVP